MVFSEAQGALSSNTRSDNLQPFYMASQPFLVRSGHLRDGVEVLVSCALSLLFDSHSTLTLAWIRYRVEDLEDKYDSSRRALAFIAHSTLVFQKNGLISLALGRQATAKDTVAASRASVLQAPRMLQCLLI